MEVSRRLGRSEAWTRRHARELGGKLVKGAWHFAAFEIERRVATSTTEKITFGRPRGEPDVGERAAAIFEMLEERRSTSEIVRALREPPAFVAKMRDEWLAGYRADRAGLEFVCGCGQPSDPSTARCVPCHARSRVLTSEQIAILGQAKERSNG